MNIWVVKSPLALQSDNFYRGWRNDAIFSKKIYIEDVQNKRPPWNIVQQLMKISYEKFLLLVK